jgi:CubicO group peptidase (beta-lactamase class C family)
VRRRLRHLAWIFPAAIAAFLGFLWLRAGRDATYLVRVLARQEADVDDHRWKAATRVAPSPTPVRWRETGECAPVAAAFAEDADASDLDSYLTHGGALALVVVRGGAIACEWYGNGGARQEPAAAFSVSKTVVSLILARAAAAGTIRLGEPITKRLPELRRRDRRFDAITLADLVDMRSGIAFSEEARFPWVDQDAPSVYYATDLARVVLERPRVESAPGAFVYNDYAPNLIGLALERATGRKLAGGPMQALWSELGAEHPAAWSVDDRGFAWHESGLVVTARDLARVGQLLLDGGRVGRRQVAPQAFLDRSLDPVGRRPAATFGDVALGYRNGWWVAGSDLIAMGRFGQIMVVSPATRTVVVRMGLGGPETNVSIAGRLRRVAVRLAR